MNPQKILLTGATGSMGKATLTELLKDTQLDVLVLVRDTEANRLQLKPYESKPNFKIHFGDLTVYEDILACMSGVDIVLHCGAFVSPAADDHPEMAMKVNYGSMLHLIRAIKAQPGADSLMQMRFDWSASVLSPKQAIVCRRYTGDEWVTLSNQVCTIIMPSQRLLQNVH